jgi:serine/threonine protein kinase/RNA polymerase subunit RPABC4/transcription elongation factor Spt4
MPQVIRSCPSCSKTVPADALVCPHCGSELPTSLIGVVAPSPDSPTSLIAEASGGGAVQQAPGSQVQRGGTLGEHEPDPLRDRLQAALGNGFELGARLGEGGFGVVYRARDVRLKRDVAVKLLRRELVSAQGFVERFEREAQALAALRHPNIVPVYSIGDQDDLIFLVMPFVSGVTLTDYLREHGRLSVAEAEQILRDVGGALSAAHAVGLVHRDIKPDNIMLEGPKKLPLLMDFGIAKTGQTGGGPSGPGLTATGMVMGTPYYMSPEQATADPAVDARSDIYSLGVLAYQLFTGQLPFTGDSIYAVLSHHLTTPVPEARTVRPDIPPRISAAVHRAMAKKPAERFQRVEEFLEALGRSGPALRRRAKPGTRTLLAAGNLILLLALATVVLSKGSARVARAPIHADLRVEGVWLRTASRVAPWERALTLSSLGLTGLDSVSLPAVDKKPARTVATPSLYVKAVRPDSGSITIDPIQLPAGSLIVLKPAQTLGTVQMTIGDSLPAIPVTVSGRMTVNLPDQPADTIPFRIDQIQLAATHGPIDFDLGFPSAQAARPLVPLDVVGVSFEDIIRFRDEDQGSNEIVSTIDSGNFAVTSGSPTAHTLKKGEALRLHGFRGTITNVTVDSETVALTLDGSVDSLPASLGTFPTKLQVFWSEHTMAAGALGLVYLTLLALVVLYWKKGTR